MTTKQDMRAWCITGSRHGHPYTERVLLGLLEQRGVPRLFVCGDAPGVDTAAFAWAQHNLPPEIVDQYFVDDKLGSPRKFHDRNERMVRRCCQGDRLIALPNGESRGTWNTVKLGALAGLRCTIVWSNGNQLTGDGRGMVNLAERNLRGAA